MSRDPTPSRLTLTGFPRVSGDEPATPKKADPAPEFSPRERG